MCRIRTDSVIGQVALEWNRDSVDWPNRAASKFVHAGGIRWHVQMMGNGPPLLLLHGTGASSHSWRDLGPSLAEHFTVISPDLPGHGFSDRLPSTDMSLPGLARLVADLLAVLEVQPMIAVGHSAGAAILVRMCIDGAITPVQLIGLNAALLPLSGLPGRVFGPAARLLSFLPGTSSLVARHTSDRRIVARLLRGTGSRIDAKGERMYARLLTSRGHVSSTIEMLAKWNLVVTEGELQSFNVPLLLIAGMNDSTVSSNESRRIARLVPSSKLVLLPRLGHLAHEEAPDIISRIIVRDLKS